MEINKIWLGKAAKKLVIGLGLGVILFLGWAGLTGKIKSDLLTPLGSKKTKSVKKEEKVVMGFLPTWMVGRARMYTNQVNRLVFLGIEVDEEGSLVWEIQAKKLLGDDFKKQKELIKENGGKVILGLKQFEDNKLQRFIENEEAMATMIGEVKELVETEKLDGVNIDFEFMGDPLAVTSDSFVDFMKKIKAAELGEVSVDVFANTVIKGDGQRINNLMNEIDQLVVMAYDFHGQGSDVSGPVAPIKANVGQRSISELIENVGSKGVDYKKVVLAYPLYGYEWQTKGAEIGSETVGGGRMVSLKEAVGYDEKEIKWDELSMTPWKEWDREVTKSRNVKVRLKSGKYRWQKQYYTETEYYQSFFENYKSLKAKLELASNSGVGGVGFWALGYEGKTDDWWKKFSEYYKK
ncbi:MAG TPA: glycosyl hydrolase family 18 protein [Candidatus Woesebacteria bacterium]|nr:glycosyl hydrolase family 18 protein [Candidatus Woesebacteria bacterium]